MSSHHESDGNPLNNNNEPYVDDSGSDAHDVADFNRKYAPSVHTQSKSAKRSQKRLFHQQQLEILRARVAHAEMEKERRYQYRLLEHEEKMEEQKQQKYPVPGNMALVPCGMATLLVNYANSGHFEMVASVPAFQIMFAGLCQQIAAVFEWMNGVTFGYTAFSTYAAFHMTFGFGMILPSDPLQTNSLTTFYDPVANPYPNKFTPTSEYFLGTYILIFTIHTAALLVCSFRMSLVLAVFLVVVFMTYLLLALGNMMPSAPVTHAGAYFSYVAGGMMLYMGTGETINSVYNRSIFPMFGFKKIEAYFKRNKKTDDEKMSDGSSQV